MVDKCMKAGCNAVKFQALSKELLARHPEWSWYSKASVCEDNIDMICRVCEGYGIDFMCTPTYPEAVGFLNEYVETWKIRHADRLNEHIVTPALNTGKKLVVSSDRPIQEYLQNEQIHQIYCVPKYPTDYGELNFDMIKLMPGFSNHCLNPLAILKAIKYGAKYIEFHVSDNKDEFAIDNKVSFSYPEVREILGWINIYETYTSLDSQSADQQV